MASGCRHAAKARSTPVTFPDTVDDHQVAFGKVTLFGPMAVSLGLVDRQHKSLERLDPMLETRSGGMIHDAFGAELAKQLDLPSIGYLVHEQTNNGLIALGVSHKDRV